MVESIHTVVAQAAMRCTGWSKDFASEAIFQLDSLSSHENLFRTWWRSICGAVQRVGNFDLLLDVGCLVLRCPRNDAGIAEGCAEESTHREKVQNAADDRNAQRDALRQERAVESKEESAGAGDEHNSQI